MGLERNNGTTYLFIQQFLAYEPRLLIRV